jgi:hypothetical protein
MCHLTLDSDKVIVLILKRNRLRPMRFQVLIGQFSIEIDILRDGLLSISMATLVFITLKAHFSVRRWQL